MLLCCQLSMWQMNSLESLAKCQCHRMNSESNYDLKMWVVHWLKLNSDRSIPQKRRYICFGRLNSSLAIIKLQFLHFSYSTKFWGSYSLCEFLKHNMKKFTQDTQFRPSFGNQLCPRLGSKANWLTLCQRNLFGYSLSNTVGITWKKKGRRSDLSHWLSATPSGFKSETFWSSVMI